jgi:hypothetical protein
MSWYRRRYNNLPLAQKAILNRFETLSLAHGGSAEMPMIEQKHTPTVSTVWLRLPAKLVSAFPEFEAGEEAELPKEAVLLAGQPAEFEKLFEYGRERS